MKVLNSLILILLINIFSCNTTENTECPEDLVCTEIFASIGTKIVNSNNEKVTLTKTVTEIEGSNNPIVTTEFNTFFDNYTVIDDSQKNKLKKQGSKVKFVAFNEKNQAIATEEFVIGHDCCHIVKMAGPEVITIK